MSRTRRFLVVVACAVALLARAPIAMATGPGEQWVDQTGLPAGYWTGVTYGSGTFVAVANSGGGTSQIMSSPDGVTWTTASGLPSEAWGGIAYGGGRFVAVGSSHSVWSVDGVTWHLVNLPRTLSTYSVAFGHGTFIAVGTNAALRSTDGGQSWLPSLIAAYRWYSIAYGEDRFVAVEQSGLSSVSTDDGATWSTPATSGSHAGAFWIAYGSGLFVSVQDGFLSTSPDGYTWTSRTVPATPVWSSVAFGDGLFMVVAGYQYGGSSPVTNGNRFLTSSDGITWTEGTYSVNEDWYALGYGNGRFIAVSAGGSGLREMSYGTLGSPNAFDASQVPPPILQQVPTPEGGDCATVDDVALAWGTSLRGGWHSAWGEWANDHHGGPVCSRTLTYDPAAGHWTVTA